MKLEVEKIKNYLTLYHPSLIKEYLWVCLFLVNFFGIAVATCDPFSQFIFYIIMPIVITINVWIIIIMFNVERKQKNYILFLGVFCFFISVIFIVAFYKVVYLMLSIHSIMPLVYAVSVYLLILVIGFIVHFKALKQGYYDLNKGGKGIGIIVGMSAIGTIVGKFIINSTDEQTILLVFALVALFLSYIFEFGVHNVYKYYLIKQYEEYVEEYNLPKEKS